MLLENNNQLVTKSYFYFPVSNLKPSDMCKNLCCILWVLLSAFFVGPLNAQNTLSFDKYHNSGEVQQILGIQGR